MKIITVIVAILLMTGVAMAQANKEVGCVPFLKSDGKQYCDSNLNWNDSGDSLTVKGITLGANQIQGRRLGHFSICGDATTVNNNTVYYGPGITLTANTSTGQNCDITAAGNVTEATADAPIFTNAAFQVVGMTCRNQADQNAPISYTLRTAGTTSTPVTCTIADNERDCVSAAQTTTAIAAGATVAIAAASTADLAPGMGFNCEVTVAFQ